MEEITALFGLLLVVHVLCAAVFVSSVRRALLDRHSKLWVVIVLQPPSNYANLAASVAQSVQ